MKSLLITAILSTFSLTACAELPLIGDQTTEPAQKLSTLTNADLTAAAAISTANGDIAGANCANALNDWLTSITPKAAPEVKTAIIGPASAFAEARVHVQKAQGIVDQIKLGLPPTVHIACAPVVLDAQQVMIKLGLAIGAVKVAPLVAPLAPVVKEALPVPLP